MSSFNLSKEEIVKLIEDLIDVVEYRKKKYVYDDKLYQFYRGEITVLYNLLNCIQDKEQFQETYHQIRKDREEAGL